MPDKLDSEWLYYSYPFVEKKETYCKIYANGRMNNLKKNFLDIINKTHIIETEHNKETRNELA